MPSRDREPERVVIDPEEIDEAFAILAASAWCVSPERTTLALILTTEASSVQFVTRHPEHRVSVLARLQQMLVNVAAASGNTTSEVH